MTLQELIIEVLKNHIPVVGVGLDENDNFVYDVAGFSKSDTATLKEKDGKIYCHTRYNQVDEINSFEDLAYIAFDWNQGYIDREPFTQYDSHWLPIFEKLHLIPAKNG